ncbi:MAG: DUF448 domain-containing protein [Armatimonadetes bacterium]|nr:DUF448 domain-containing protein [Armatimonadota bacterium]
MSGTEPERTCVVCRQKGPQSSFLRVRWSPDSARLTASGAGVGRSAYSCRSRPCTQAMLTGPHLARALKSDVPDGLKVALRQELECPQR